MTDTQKDKAWALLFLAFTIAFLLLALNNSAFFNWAFKRHHNQWSWYIRPLFLLPFCYFAYKHSMAGISATVFCLFTSMFWFSRPDQVTDSVKTFLQFEMDWINSAWDGKKIGLLLSIPASFLLLGLSFWKRSLYMGLGVVVLMATGKILWSILNAGESGKSILLPAVLGLLICAVLMVYGFKRLERGKRKKQ